MTCRDVCPAFAKELMNSLNRRITQEAQNCAGIVNIFLFVILEEFHLQIELFRACILHNFGRVPETVVLLFEIK